MIRPDVLDGLKQMVNKDATITCFDGEVIVATIISVSEIEEDVIYHLISTNRESQYAKYDKQPVYQVKFEDIKSVKAAVGVDD